MPSSSWFQLQKTGTLQLAVYYLELIHADLQDFNTPTTIAKTLPFENPFRIYARSWRLIVVFYFPVLL